MTETDRHEPSAPDEVALAVAKVFVADVISALPPRQAAVLELHYILDLPLVQVAERLGVSINTVKSHNRSALNRLRRTLGDPDE